MMKFENNFRYVVYYLDLFEYLCEQNYLLQRSAGFNVFCFILCVLLSDKFVYYNFNLQKIKSTTLVKTYKISKIVITQRILKFKRIFPFR